MVLGKSLEICLFTKVLLTLAVPRASGHSHEVVSRWRAGRMGAAHMRGTEAFSPKAT